MGEELKKKLVEKIITEWAEEHKNTLDVFSGWDSGDFFDYARKLMGKTFDEARCDSFKNVLKLLSEIGERYCKEHDKHPESVLLNQSIVVINVIKEKIKELERKFKP